MKSRYVCCLALLTAAVLSGCKGNLMPTPDELDQFEIVQVVGIDKSSEDPSQIEVTLIIQSKTGGQEKGSSGSSNITVLSASASTVFEAVREIKASSDKIIFLGQVDYFLIGEEAAKEDFTKYYDLIQRGPDIRLSTKIYVVRDCPIKQFITETSSPEDFIVDRLDALKTDRDLLSDTDETTIIDVSSMLDTRRAATIIPALTCKEIKNKTSTGKLPERDIEVGGYAVIKDFKLVGYLDPEYAQGYNFLINKVSSCPVNVSDPSGACVSLELVRSDTDVIAHFDGNKLTGVTYRTHTYSNLEEQHSRENLLTDPILEELATKQSEVLHSKMQQVIDASMEFGIDCTGLGQIISLKHPFKWDHLKENWAEIYPELQIDIVVESEVARSYDINEPNGYEAER